MGCAWGSTPKSVCFNKVGSGRAALTTALSASLRPFSTGRCGKPRLRLVRCDWDHEASGGPWELWLLPLFGLSYSACDVAAGIFNPEALVFRAQVVPVVPIFGYPVGDPLSTFPAFLQGIDLFARSHLSWQLGLGDLSRSGGFWTIAKAVVSLREASQKCRRLFSTASASVRTCLAKRLHTRTLRGTESKWMSQT